MQAIGRTAGVQRVESWLDLGRESLEQKKGAEEAPSGGITNSSFKVESISVNRTFKVQSLVHISFKFKNIFLGDILDFNALLIEAVFVMYYPPTILMGRFVSWCFSDGTIC